MSQNTCIGPACPSKNALLAADVRLVQVPNKSRNRCNGVRACDLFSSNSASQKIRLSSAWPSPYAFAKAHLPSSETPARQSKICAGVKSGRSPCPSANTFSIYMLTCSASPRPIAMLKADKPAFLLFKICVRFSADIKFWTEASFNISRETAIALASTPVCIAVTKRGVLYISLDSRISIALFEHIFSTTHGVGNRVAAGRAVIR